MNYEQAIKVLENLPTKVGIMTHKWFADIDEALLLAVKTLREKSSQSELQPLSLEELEQKHGEPVWIQFENKNNPLEHSSWYLFTEIVGRSVHVQGFTSPLLLCLSDYNKTWRAYGQKVNA